MKLFPGQPANWKPQPHSSKEMALIWFGGSAVMLSFAAATLFAGGACAKSSQFFCRLVGVVGSALRVSHSQAELFSWCVTAAVCLVVGVVFWVRKA
jgi:hypothetical protein